MHVRRRWIIRRAWLQSNRCVGIQVARNSLNGSRDSSVSQALRIIHLLLTGTWMLIPVNGVVAAERVMGMGTNVAAI
jgi:hypothetical protein